jgi:hypothetical protein
MFIIDLEVIKVAKKHKKGFFGEMKAFIVASALVSWIFDIEDFWPSLNRCSSLRRGT